MIRSYSTDATRELPFPFRFSDNEKGAPEPRFLGVEWEVELKPGTNISLISEQLDHEPNRFVINKSDGTINFGIEIVSVPATLTYHKHGATSNGASPWNAIQAIIGDHLATHNHHVGVHIHVNKTSILPLTLLKLTKLITHPPSTAKLAILGGRSIFNGHHRSAKKVLKRADCTHSDPINITKPHTVEFRHFTSPHHYTRVLANLELVDSLLQWAAQESMTQTTFDRYKKWFLSTPTNTALYPYIYNHMRDKFNLSARLKYGPKTYWKQTLFPDTTFRIET